jgi:hypothetical protein
LKKASDLEKNAEFGAWYSAPQPTNLKATSDGIGKYIAKPAKPALGPRKRLLELPAAVFLVTLNLETFYYVVLSVLILFEY